MSMTSILTSPATGFDTVHFAEDAPGAAALEAAGIRLAAIDGAAVSSKQDLMAALADAFELPDYFGHNWDALHEVLRDLSWFEGDGHVLVVAGSEILWRRHPELAGTLVSVWTDSAREVWGPRAVSFHLVFAR